MQPTSQHTLPRVLGPWIATAIIVGTVIGSGVFVKGRVVANNVPEFGMIMAVWVLGGVLALLGSLALAEVAVLFPHAGGNYVFLREGYGRMAGFLWGCVEFLIIRGASAAALATMFTASFHDVLRQSLYPGQKDIEVLAFWPRQLMTVLLLVGLTAISVRGTFLSGAVQFAITVLKVASIIFIIVLPFVVYAAVSEPTHPPKSANLSPAWPTTGLHVLKGGWVPTATKPNDQTVWKHAQGTFEKTAEGKWTEKTGERSYEYQEKEHDAHHIELFDPIRRVSVLLADGRAYVFRQGMNWSLFGVALVGVLWAYNGWMNIAPVAGEVKDPQRSIPFALIVGVVILIVLYCGAQVAYHLVLPHDVIVKKDAAGQLSSTPLATEFVAALLGPVGLVIASAIVMTSVLGALNGNILVGPRLLYAMGHDRLAPAKLSEVHPRYKTPANATWVMTAWGCLLVVCVGALTQYKLPLIPLGFHDLDLNVPQGKSPFDIMTDFVIFGSVTFETLAVATIFVFRRRIPVTPENRPYRCWGYPIVPALYVLIMAVVLVNMFASPEQRTEAVVGMGFIGAGAVAYLVFFRKRVGPAA